MTRHHSVLRLLAAALAAAAVVPVGPAFAQPNSTGQPPNSIGVRLVDAPEDQADDPRARSAIIDHVIPGARLARRMQVVSTLDAPVEVEVYGVNAHIREGGFRPDPEATRGLADWVTVSPATLQLDAMGEQVVEVAIDVPPATPTGEYYGIIAAEPPSSSANVAVANRVGVRVYLSVGTGDDPPVDFAVGRMTAGRDEAGVPYVSTGLRNTGGRALDISGTLSLSEGPAGLAAGPFRFEGGITVLPGEIHPLRIYLDPELPDGPWLAEIRAFSGLLERTAEGEVLFPTESDTEAAPAETEVTGGTDAQGNDISEQLRNQRRVLLPLAAILILLTLAALYVTQWMKRPVAEVGEGDEDASADTPVGAGDAEA